MPMNRESAVINEVGDAERRLAPPSFEHCFEGHAVRSVVKDGQPWFVAADVCAVLEHTTPSVALRRLDADEKGMTIVHTLGGPQELAIISEGGFYALVLTSRKPRAKTFARWVRGTVLPSLRRTASGEAIPEGKNVAHIALEVPGRYRVSALPGRPIHIQRMSLLSMGGDTRTSDVEVLALNIQLAATLWRRLRMLQSLGGQSERGFTEDQLDDAMLNADQVAERFLRAAQDQTADAEPD
jgi:hypothetical protein